MVDSKQIQSVTTPGIIYTDDNGNEKFIDFSECYNTWLKWLTPQARSEREIQWWRSQKQVGEISWYDDDEDFQFVVEFYDKVSTSFVFKDEKVFSFQETVQNAGWSLFDGTD
jgi:hypothetical protein